MQDFTVSQDGANVLLRIRNGGRECHIEMSWSVADDLIAALREKARAAEEHAKANDLVFDQALMIRTGAPFALTSHPDILREAAKEAAHNPVLRKHLTAIKSTEHVGAPRLTQHSPRKES